MTLLFEKEENERKEIEKNHNAQDNIQFRIITGKGSKLTICLLTSLIKSRNQHVLNGKGK